MRAFLTTCSAEKRRDAGLLPAVLRYTHPRIADAARAAADADRPLLILSGVFGLLDAHTPTPWYDHALQGCDVHVLAPRVAGRLVSRRITTLELVMDHPDTPGWAPYHAVVVQAARHAGVRLRPRWSAQP